jgi:aerobic-type carbon monoxide dehydrogenase small subunit (CoxS/CutS family)
LRAWRLRRLHRLDRRRRHTFLSDARGPGRRQTVESLVAADGTLNPLQQAFRDNHALQCGFCTPGILMSFTDYLKRNPKPSEGEIRDVLSGHLCRCTGYAGIVAAIKQAAGG